MAFRFRKSVRIMPGLKVNFSSSGTSVTVGPKGFTTTYSKRGKFRNISIPGTGLSTRYKIDSAGNKKRSSAQTRGRQSLPAAVQEWIAYTGEKNPRVSLEISPDGTLLMYDSHDQVIKDERLIGIIKRTPTFKEQIPHIKQRHQEEVSRIVRRMTLNNDFLLQAYKRAPIVLQEKHYELALKTLVAPVQEPKPYAVKPPKKSEIRHLLEKEAEHEVCAPFFARKKKRAEYVRQHWEERYTQALNEWQTGRTLFEEQELLRVQNELFAAEAVLNVKRNAFQAAIDEDGGFIEAAIERWVTECSLPVEIDIQFEYRKSEHCLMVDLDLPEIEDLPTELPVQLANGDLRIKTKTQKQLRSEYSECVFGLAIYVAANLFNASPAIERTVLSAYTQRRNRKGDVINEYIYSIRFLRDGFTDVDFERVDPERFCMHFENRCNLSTTKAFKSIEPFN